MITLPQYFMGRDKQFFADLTAEIRANAEDLIVRVNKLLQRAAADSVFPGRDQVTGAAVASGWRPPGVNARTSNAAKGSSHLIGRGVDLQDTPDRALACWCLAHEADLAEFGLWMERPQWTGGADPWVHLQSRPVPGKRVYRPSMAEPTAALLPGEEVFA